MKWNEETNTLTIGDRKGDFPGMLKDRTFRIVWVKGQNGAGIEPAKVAEVIRYSGKEIKIIK
jgi:alpha-D-xyloside xylohydrolase